MSRPASGAGSAAGQPSASKLRNQIRLICLDIDGTLLDSQQRLRERVKRALLEAERAGVTIAVFTGRNLNSTQPVLDKLGLGVAVVTDSGAHLLMPDGRSQELSLEPEQAAFVVEWALREGSGMFCDRPGPSWAIGNEAYVKQYAFVSNNAYTTDIARALNPPPIKISVINEKTTLDRLRLVMRERYPHLHLASPFETVLDVTPPGATKGIALHTLAGMLGIPPGETAAIGDSENDLPMFEEAALSVAMGNAPDAVRAAADWIAPSNDEDGVAWAVARILAGEAAS